VCIGGAGGVVAYVPGLVWLGLALDIRVGRDPCIGDVPLLCGGVFANVWEGLVVLLWRVADVDREGWVEG